MWFGGMEVDWISDTHYIYYYNLCVNNNIINIILLDIGSPALCSMTMT